MELSHKVYIAFLFLLGMTAVLSLSVHGCDYYSTPVAERAFRPDYAIMRPSGNYSHGLGIGPIGSRGVAGSFTRRTSGSSVTKSASDATASPPVSALKSVVLPALV